LRRISAASAKYVSVVPVLSCAARDSSAMAASGSSERT
jgi:hypothetical protein